MTDAGTARRADLDGTAPTIGTAGTAGAGSTAGDGTARTADVDGTARTADGGIARLFRDGSGGDGTAGTGGDGSARRAGAAGTARRGRADGRWRAWRRSRPFWGGLLVTLGAVEMLVTLRAPLPVILHIGPQGLAGYLVPVILLLCGVLLVAQPAQRVFYALISLVLALASWLTSNMGGFVVGMLLALVGGCLAFAWTPVKAPRPARHPATHPATDRATDSAMDPATAPGDADAGPIPDADAGPIPDANAGPAPGAVVGTAPTNDATAGQSPYSKSAPQADWVASSQPPHRATPYPDDDGRHRWTNGQP